MRAEEALKAASLYPWLKALAVIILSAIIVYRVVLFARRVGLLNAKQLYYKLLGYMVYSPTPMLVLAAAHTSLAIVLATHLPLITYMVSVSFGLESYRLEELVVSLWGLHSSVGLAAGAIAVMAYIASATYARRVSPLTLHVLATLATGVMLTTGLMPSIVHVAAAYTLAIHLVIGNHGFHWVKVVYGLVRNPYTLLRQCTVSKKYM